MRTELRFLLVLVAGLGLVALRALLADLLRETEVAQQPDVRRHEDDHEGECEQQTLDQLEAKLSKVINDEHADEAMVLHALERVEAARGELSKSRTLMGFRMRRILTADQNVKMRALHEQWERERRNRSAQHNHNNRG